MRHSIIAVIVAIISFSTLSNAQNLQHDWSFSTGYSYTSAEWGKDVTIDPFGNLYVAGIFEGIVDFDPDTSTVNLTGSNDVFIQKLTPNGDLIWAKSLEGSSYDRVGQVTTDSLGNVYVSGSFASTVDFDPGSGTFNLTATSYDAFILKLDSAGNFVWAKKIGSVWPDYGNGLAVRGNQVFLSGTFAGTVDFNPGAGVSNHTSNGSVDGYIVAFDTLGNYQWSRTLGGTGIDNGSAVAARSGGSELVLTGRFQNTIDLNPGTGTDSATSQGSWDVFTIALDDSGAYQWGHSVGGGFHDQSYDVVATAENIYVTGQFVDSVDFDPGVGTQFLVSNDHYGTFIQKLDWSGDLTWALVTGDSAGAVPRSISLDASENIVVSGSYEYPGDFDPGTGVAQMTSVGNEDVFVVKFDSSGTFQWVAGAGSSGMDIGYGVEASMTGSIFCTGQFNDTIDLDPTGGVVNHISNGGSDIFTFRWIECLTQTTTSSDTGCLSYTWTSNNQTYTSSGTYYDTLTSAGGCDSILQLNLTILNGGMSSDTVQTCGSYTWSVNNETYTLTGIYTDTISSGACDSVVVLNLTILQEDSFTDSIATCSAYTWPVDSQTYTASGIYILSFTKANGCDSVYVLDLTIGGSTVTNISLDTCGAYTWPLTGQTLTTSGTYSDTISSSSGCDSVVVLDLNIELVNTDVVLNAAQTGAVAQGTGVDYQWLDCSNGYSPISGATQQHYVSQGGDTVAVEISKNGCVDTSDCYILKGLVGIEESLSSDVKVFPNPASEFLRLQFSGATKFQAYRIIDIRGRAVRQGFISPDVASLEIPVSGLTAGVYIMELSGESPWIERIQILD